MSVLSVVTYSGGEAVKTPLPTPLELEQTYSKMDASTSGRSQSGLMFRDVVAVKRKVVAKFPALYASDVSTIMQLWDNPFFYLEYPDAHDGTDRIMECYAGDIPTPTYTQIDGEWKYKPFSVSFIER